jgi:2'-5' RNA ligase
MRCFIAIKLPKEVKDEVARIQGQLRRLDLHAKWVEFQNLHITIKFLGEIKEELLPKIKEIISGINPLVKPFVLALSEVGGFPSLGRPRVLWLGINPQDNPIKIIEYLDEQLPKIGIPKETRPAHPHITLARIKSPKNVHKIKQKITTLGVEKK